MRETTAAQIPLCLNLQQGQVRAAALGGVAGVGAMRGWGGGGDTIGGGGGGGPGPESIYVCVCVCVYGILHNTQYVLMSSAALQSYGGDTELLRGCGLPFLASLVQAKLVRRFAHFARDFEGFLASSRQ